MIEIRQGDCLGIAEGVIVHGCNAQGVMGSGIAGALRDKWPSVYQAYRRHYNKVGLRLGDSVTVGSTQIGRGHPRVLDFLEATVAELPANVIVVNGITQFRYGKDRNIRYVDYDAIEAVFARAAALARVTGLPLHFPLIGCGLANGEWSEVSARIEHAAHNVETILWKLPGT